MKKITRWQRVKYSPLPAHRRDLRTRVELGPQRPCEEPMTVKHEL